MSTLPTLQDNGATIPFRYWTETKALAQACAPRASLSVLSFGCSSGEELQTLRSAFPHALLFGCEVNAERLAIAREKVGAWAELFPSSPEELLRHGPFDVVTVNSVLLDSSRPNGVDAQAWLDVLASIDAVLAPGGLLQIINSNIAFRRHPVAANYAPLRCHGVIGSNFASQFNLEGRLLAEGVTGLGRSAHLHRHIGTEHWRLLDAHDLDDVHFRKQGGAIPRVEAEPMRANDAIIAHGEVSYTAEQPQAGASYVCARALWQASAAEVWVSRRAQRIWFDGSIAHESHVEMRLTELEGRALLEMASARPVTPPADWSRAQGDPH